MQVLLEIFVKILRMGCCYLLTALAEKKLIQKILAKYITVFQTAP